MMKTIQIPYYTSSLDLHVEESNLEAVITAKTDSFDPGMSEAALVEQALANPIGTPRLRELAKGRKKVTLVTSDHTRAVPSKITLPILLEEIRAARSDVMLDAPQYLGVQSLDASGVVLRFWVKVAEKDIYAGTRALNRELLLGFRRLGVECPYPQMDIHTK